MADAPLGIFDSGFGGLTVARSVIDQLPHESIVYVGDTARQPYGPKPIGEVREWFAASTSRRLAFIADDGRYAGSLTPEHVADEDDLARLAVELAEQGPTVPPDAPATTGRDLALLTIVRWRVGEIAARPLGARIRDQAK